MNELDTFSKASPERGDILVDTDFLLFSLPNWSGYIDFGYPLSVLDILSLFAFAEALVLNERILTNVPFPGMQKYPRMAKVYELLQNGLIRCYRENEALNYREPDNYLRQTWQAIEGDIEQLSPEDWYGADFTLTRSRAAWATKSGIDHLSRIEFGSLSRASIAQPAQSLIHKIYNELETTLLSKMLELKGVGCPIPMYIPPIPALILERCEGEASRFFDEVILLRNDFEEFRSKYQQY